jgi:protein-S-isoprenylcysteine O-methyltransferase Ste14
MPARIIKASLLVVIATILPLAGRQELIVNPQIMVIVVAGLVMMLTQPELRRREAKNCQSSDRWSVIAILIAGVISQVLPILEWGYRQDGASGNSIVTALGLAMMVGGLTFRVWSIRTLGKFFTATVQIVEEHRVITAGPFRLVRHPSYLGAYLAITGSSVFLNSPISACISAVAMAAAYWLRISAEEKTLIQHFGRQYADYQKTTKMIVPLIW